MTSRHIEETSIFCPAAAEALVADFICIFISFLMNMREEAINMEKELLSLGPHERGGEVFIASTPCHPNSALYLTVYDKQSIC